MLAAIRADEPQLIPAAKPKGKSKAKAKADPAGKVKKTNLKEDAPQDHPDIWSSSQD